MRDDPAVWARLDRMEQTLDLVLQEIRAMRRAGLRCSTRMIPRLCEAIDRVFEGREFTAVWLLEACLEGDEEAMGLHRAIVAAVGGGRTVGRVTRFLNRACGTYGPWRLEVSRAHSRNGRLFIVRCDERDERAHLES